MPQRTLRSAATISITFGLSVAGCHETAQPTAAAAVTKPAVVIAATAGTAGPAATAPTPAAPTTPAAVNAGQCPKQLLLDDLEDGDSGLLVQDQRSGFWSTYADTIGSTIAPSSSAEFKVESPGSEGSSYAVRIHGRTAPHGTVYAGVGFWFTRDKLPYDASCCTGVAFRAKRSKTSIDTVRLKVGDIHTLPEGNVCKNCYNDFGIDLGFVEDWKLYRIPFENMRQSPGWGESYPSITPGRLLQIQWQISHPNFDFDIWIDDVQLFDCAATK